MMILREDQGDSGFEAGEQPRSDLERLEPLFQLDAEGVQRAAWDLAGDTPLLEAGEIFLGGLNQAFVATRLGMDQGAVAENWPVLREAYARAAYGSDPQTEEEFKGLAAEEMTQWRRAEDARTFESIYAGESNGVSLPVEKPPQWWTPDGGVEQKFSEANRAYFSFLQGKELNDEEYAETRRTYARENLGKEDTSEDEVFFNIGNRFTAEKLKREVEQKASDFWRKTQTRWAAGREQAWNDQLAYRALTGEVPWESVKDQLEPKTDITTARGESWYGEGFLSAVGALPAMIESMAEGSRKGAAFAVTGAAAAAVGGQAGPQAAAPEEIITVPGAAIMGYGVGETSGMADYWFRQGAGSLYHELRKEGIPHGVAQKVSAAFGVPYAGIQLLQLTKLVPGMKQTVARTVAGAVKQRMLALAREKGVEYLEQIGQETTQEVLQIAAEALAEGIAGVRPPEDKRPALGRIWDTITQTAASMPFLMLSKTATDAVATVRGGGQGARSSRTPGLLDVLTPEQQAHVATAPNAEAMLGRYQEILAGDLRFSKEKRLAEWLTATRGRAMKTGDELPELAAQSIARRALADANAAVGGGGFQALESSDAAHLRESPGMGAAIRLADLFGRRIVVFRNAQKPWVNGFINRQNPGVIFLNADSARPFHTVTGHELWEHLRIEQPDLARSTWEALAPEVRNWEKYRQARKADGYAETDIQHELMGDFLGDSVSDPAFWDRLGQRNPTVFRRFAVAVKEWLDGLVRVLKRVGFGTHEYFGDIERAQSILADAVAQFAGGDRSKVPSHEPGDANQNFYPGSEQEEKTTFSEGSEVGELKFSRSFEYKDIVDGMTGVHYLAKPRGMAFKSDEERRSDPAVVLDALAATARETGKAWKPGREVAAHPKLIAWAASNDKIIEQISASSISSNIGGGEHIVFSVPEVGRLWKMTKPGLYGAHAEDAGAYLQRWALSNHVFGDNVAFEGLVKVEGEDDFRSVISQAFVEGRDATPAEITGFLKSKGFYLVDHHWIHPVTGVSVWDVATAGNALTDPEGNVVPVDFVLEPASSEALQQAREISGMTKSPFITGER